MNLNIQLHLSLLESDFLNVKVKENVTYNYTEQFFSYWVPAIIELPNYALIPVPHSQNTKLQYRQKGDKNRRSTTRTVIAPLWGKNAHSRKSPTSCLQPPDSSEPAVLIPEWLGSFSGLKHGKIG